LDQLTVKSVALRWNHVAQHLGKIKPIIHLKPDRVGRPALDGHEAPEHWPYRNQMLITVAAMALADENLESLSIGTVRSGRVHADGTLTFLSAMDALLRAQNPYLSLKAPAADWTTLELVERATAGRDLLGWTFSCHRSSIACGTCRGCNKTLSL